MAIGTQILSDAFRSGDGLFPTPRLFEGRLTLETGVPISTSDQTAKTTLYLTPFRGDRIALHDNSSANTWRIYSFEELSISLPATTNTNYDVFVYDNSGTMTLELVAWSSDTARATALATLNGTYVQSGATNKKFAGCVRTGSVSGKAADSLALRHVWNNYNRVPRPMRVFEATDFWTYSTSTYRQANGSAANQLDFLIGLSEEPVVATATGMASSSTATLRAVQTAIGLDSTSAYATGCNAVRTGCDSVVIIHMVSTYRGFPGIGRHYLSWLEWGAGADTQTWYGDGGGSNIQSGIQGEVWG